MQAENQKKLNLDRAVFGMAGTFILVSVILGLVWTPWVFAVTLFVGANMLQAAFTGFCPAAIFFSKLGLRPGCLFK
ncbi:MAG: DUF2892 domain-containing protein [Oceanipulchritudo sp.]